MDRTKAYQRLRTNIGRTILLGLEVLIVADIVLTVAIDQTIESAITLGIIVLVRTFLSFSLEIELEGVVPWHRRAVEARRPASPVVGGTRRIARWACDSTGARPRPDHASAQSRRQASVARGSSAIRAEALVQIAARSSAVAASSLHVITAPRRR